MSKTNQNLCSLLTNSAHWNVFLSSLPENSSRMKFYCLSCVPCISDRVSCLIWSTLVSQVYSVSVSSAQPWCIYISLPIFASVTAVAGENLAHILLNQSAAIAVDSETWQVVWKWVLFNSLFIMSLWHTHSHSAAVLHMQIWLGFCMCVIPLKSTEPSQRMRPGIVSLCVCTRVGVFLIWIPWSTFNPYFSFIWSLMRLLSQFKDKKILSSIIATFGLVYQHHY